MKMFNNQSLAFGDRTIAQVARSGVECKGYMQLAEQFAELGFKMMIWSPMLPVLAVTAILVALSRAQE